MINRLINIKFKISIQFGRSDCGGEISKKPKSLWGTEISSHRQFKYYAAFKNKEKNVYFKHLSVFREKCRYKVLKYLGCILSDP